MFTMLHAQMVCHYGTIRTTLYILYDDKSTTGKYITRHRKGLNEYTVRTQIIRTIYMLRHIGHHYIYSSSLPSMVNIIYSRHYHILVINRIIMKELEYHLHYHISSYHCYIFSSLLQRHFISLFISSYHHIFFNINWHHISFIINNN